MITSGSTKTHQVDPRNRCTNEAELIGVMHCLHHYCGIVRLGPASHMCACFVNEWKKRIGEVLRDVRWQCGVVIRDSHTVVTSDWFLDLDLASLCRRRWLHRAMLCVVSSLLWLYCSIFTGCCACIVYRTLCVGSIYDTLQMKRKIRFNCKQQIQFAAISTNR